MISITQTKIKIHMLLTRKYCNLFNYPSRNPRIYFQITKRNSKIKWFRQSIQAVGEKTELGTSLSNPIL